MTSKQTPYHSSHDMRYSDSSFYDEKCDACGMTEDSNGIKEPCKRTPRYHNVETTGLISQKEHNENTSVYLESVTINSADTKKKSTKLSKHIDSTENPYVKMNMALQLGLNGMRLSDVIDEALNGRVMTDDKDAEGVSAVEYFHSVKEGLDTMKESYG